MKARCLNIPAAMGVVLFIAGARAAPVGSAFTYQGRLNDGGSAAIGVYDLQFSLWDAASAGAQVGGTVCSDNVSIAKGLFTVTLNAGGEFGPAAFNGQARWLQIGVRPGGAPGNCAGGAYTPLSPRQPLTPGPYALHALSSAGGAALWSPTGEHIHNTNSGNVGIGTAAPASNLHVAGGTGALRLDANDDAASYFLLDDRQPTQAKISKFNGAGLVLIDVNPMPADGAGNGIIRFFRDTNTTGTKRVDFLRGNNSTSASAVIGVDGTDSVFQLHGGNLGVGTAAPATRLHVEGGSDSGLAGGGFLTLGPLTGANLGIDSNEIMARNNESASPLYLNHNGGDVLLSAAGDGNVGIGTDNPVARLYVFNDSGTQAALHCSQVGTGTAAALSIINGNSTASTVNATTLGKGRAGSFQITNATSNASALYCSTTGDGYAFQAAGRAHIAVDQTGVAALHVSSPAGCTGDPDGFRSCTGYAIDAHGPIKTDNWVVGAVKSFCIDHPLDPENRYLMHASIESSDMKNLYDGVAVLDDRGEAWVELPAWFEALNGDFRYQLTCIGGHAPVYVASEIQSGRFQIAGGRAGLKVSWQVTGIRRDAFAKAHGLAVEPLKNERERGRYVHPELYGRPPEMGISNLERPEGGPSMSAGQPTASQ